MDYNLIEVKVVEIPKDDFDQIFQQIRKTPQLILPRHSIFDFYAFYTGYVFYRSQHNILLSEGDVKFDNFIEWVRNKCDIKTNMSWANLIFAYSSDERSALDYLFKLYDQYTSISEDRKSLIMSEIS